MLKIREVAVEIGGTVLPSFVQVVLHQLINTHHYFEVILDAQTVETYTAGTLEASRDWVGGKVRLHLGGQTFVGVATSVSLHRAEGSGGTIRVSGLSSTFLLESAHTCASWCGKTLAYIVGELASRAGVQASVNPETKSTLDYECQYEESDFRFIQRLARQYGEWLYYDGMSLVFGKPGQGASVQLTYGRDLYELDVCSQVLARPLRGYSYNSGTDQSHEGNSPDSVTGLGQVGQAAVDASMAAFTTPAVQHPEPRVSSKGELDTYLQRRQQCEAAASHFITGESECMDLTIGGLVDVSAEAHTGIGIYTEQSVGSYIITEITHVAGQGGSYRNTFTALPSQTQSLPCPDVPMPVAHTQQAVVVDNNDPEGQGRVRVRMGWQADGMQTSWIRVLVPDAGISGKVSSNRGFVFVPEVGDLVMVAFRHDDPNRPFVMGSLFNGKTAKGGGSDNKTKSITTRSGCTVTFDDEKGSVTIADPSGSTVILNGDKTITIDSKDKISIHSKEIEIKADEKIHIEADSKVEVLGKTSTFEGTSEAKIKSNTSIKENAPTINIKAETSLKVSGKTVDVEGTAMTNVKGGILNLNP